MIMDFTINPLTANPQWANAAQTRIQANITFPGIGEIPFLASGNDVEGHGQAIFDALVDGDGGSIAAYDANLFPDLNHDPWDVLRSKRDDLLRDSDWRMLPDSPLTPEKKTEWEEYRQELRDLPDNTVDPTAPVWPNPPLDN